MITASVNYHVSSTAPQAFHIDPDDQVGVLRSPELAPTRVSVRDTRVDDVSVDFDTDCVTFAQHASDERAFDAGGDWRGRYDAELEVLLARTIGAVEVVVFDHTVRTDDPTAERRPARNVHCDYSERGAHERLPVVLGADRARDWAAGRFGFVNVWRPVGRPVTSAPLGFVRPRSVSPEDWEVIGLVYPDRRGEILGLIHAPRHEWIYRSTMAPDEVAIFSVFDSAGRPPLAHSALDLVDAPPPSAPRVSVESRTIVRYP